MDPHIVSGAAVKLSSEAANGIFQEVKRHMRRVISYKKNVEKFDEKLKMLMAKRTSVQQLVDAADRNGEKIKADVQLWRNTVDRVIEEEDKKVKVLEVKAKRKYFIGLCPNIKSRYQLSRKAEKDATVFEDLIGQGQFNGVGYRDVRETMMDTHEPPRDFEAFKSREKVFNDLVEALKDATLSLVGVSGMGGVGKTSLVKEVARQAQEAKLFDNVVMVIVSQAPDIQKIQDHVAEMLGLKLEEKSPVARARRLCERLKKEERILVVLDDIWAELDLKEVGIPFGNQHKGVKILLTSRDQNVLSNGMEAQKTFAIDVLDEEEAWQLFKKMAGDNVESVELRSTALEVAKRCARLPLAISTVARALRNKRLFAWKDALRQLQTPSPENFTGISAKVYQAIKLSYDHLQSEEHKQIFMLCSLFRRGSIENLLRYALGLGLFNGVKTVEEARNRLLTLVSNLKESCLLLSSNNGDRYFDMHDIVYDVAITITFTGNHIFALRKEDVLKDWPEEENMKKCHKIYFEHPRISELPYELNCPQLVIFTMHSKDLSLEIPTNFFRETINLQVLDLSEMNFSFLPSSISLLTSLHTLCLDLCELGDIAIVKELKSLEIVSLAKSDIRILPEEIGCLFKLKLLDLSHCTKLKIIPPGILPGLSRLEELYMGDTSIQWAAEGHANQESNASLAELETLSSLTTLEVHIRDANAIPVDSFFVELLKLQSYKIFVGNEWGWFGEDEYSRTLKLSLSISTDQLVHGIKLLLKRTEDLHLGELKGVKIAMQNLKDEGILAHLKNLHIQNGWEIKYIIDGNDLSDFLQLRSLTLQDLPQLISFCSEDESGSTSVTQHKLSLFSEKVFFPCLESLRLSSISVERIWLSHVSAITHENLSMLTIEGCDNLKHLLPISVARMLMHLKHFEIVGCQSLREIIFTEDTEKENGAEISFPKLNSLKMRDLQHVTAFCLENYNVDFPSLKLLVIENCPELKGFIYKPTEGNATGFSCQALFDRKVSFPSLEELRISNMRNMKIIWRNQFPENSFRRLQRLHVESCDALLTIFPSNILRRFQAVQTLSIKQCASLEEVYEFESVNMDETDVLCSQLIELTLHGLPYLNYIWKNDPQGVFTFENLRVVDVLLCWNLKNIFPASVARALPQLKVLKLECCGVLEIVSKDEGLETAVTFEFNQLSSLRLYFLSKLKYFYPGVHKTKWPMLKRLKAFQCNNLKIFNTENPLGCIPNMSKDEQFESPSLLLAEKVIPKLERLTLNNDDIAMISGSQFSRSLFHQIKVLRVTTGINLEYGRIPISLLERFYNLEKLTLNYSNLKELFPSEEDMGKETYARTPLTIRRLKLFAVANLQYIWKEDVAVDQILPNLATLYVWGCDHMISLGSSSASFQNLTILLVWRCKAMVNLVTSSAIQSLAQLKTLCVMECVLMKEIVGDDGDEGTNEITFSKLKSLRLLGMPRLKSFCSGNHTFEFPSLEEVMVETCPLLEVFCKGVLRAPILQGVKVTYDNHMGRGHWSGDLNCTIQQLYAKKVGYQGVQNLVLSEFSESIEMWTHDLQGVVDFKKLTYVEVFGCNNFKYIFTVSMALGLIQCSEIKVKSCLMLEQIIINGGAEETETGPIMLPRLWSITIESCSNLSSFCAASITVECPSLVIFDVTDCPKMSAFVSTSPMENGKSFVNDKVTCPNLQRLNLVSTNTGNLFPSQLQVTCSNVKNLKLLSVGGCHNLKHLFSSCLIKHFMQLKMLSIDNCKNMEEVIYDEDGLEEAQWTTQMLLFPKLEELLLGNLPKLERFCHGDNLESDTLTLNEQVKPKSTTKFICPKMRTVIISELPKLESSYSKLEIFPLKELWLLELSELTHLWEEEISPGEVFNELSYLNVSACSKLKNNLLPSSVSLENLTTLKVSKCHGLRSLVTLTTAKSMVLLTTMSITDCQILEEIITSTSDEVTGGRIVFSQLKSLELRSLPSLSCFCSGNYTIEFPSLEGSIMRNCPKMEIFSKGEISKPMLQLQDNLDAITQQLFMEKILPSLEDMEVLSIKIQRIWHEKFLAFSSVMTSLSMEGCHGLNCLFSSSMVESLAQLKMLSVENCENVEKVVFIERLAKEETMRNKLFPKLEFLSLKYLPTLTRFCHGNHIELPILRILKIQSCPTLKTFISGSEGNNSEIASPTLLDEKVAFPCLEELIIIGAGNWKNIWHNQSTNSARIHFANH